MVIGAPSESLRKKLLEEELRLRTKQPEHWAKTKYRKYAKPFSLEEMEKIKELEAERKTVKRKLKKKKDAWKKRAAAKKTSAKKKPKPGKRGQKK